MGNVINMEPECRCSRLNCRPGQDGQADGRFQARPHRLHAPPFRPFPPAQITMELRMCLADHR